LKFNKRLFIFYDCLASVLKSDVSCIFPRTILTIQATCKSLFDNQLWCSRPMCIWSLKTVLERGSLHRLPSNPNGCKGIEARILQDRA
jgi:hypothetical protein